MTKHEFVCGWQDVVPHPNGGTGGRVLGFRRAAPPAGPRGAGDVHAVRPDTGYTAVCGAFLRIVGTLPWPPGFGDQCEVCVRLTAP
ncbi:MAG: hypothetical protein QOK14_1034 [Frankiaceae bacterium]|jgi:hypothetical protein|nr:hypothetical protein [Frankiaceae bacterium]